MRTGQRFPGIARLYLFILAIFISTISFARADETPPLLTEKKVFQMESYQTVGGAVIRDVKVGWESYGNLNQDKSNAILIAHYFSGNSHAAGKYAPDDKAAGYWDNIIGPGKAIDTDKYFVISADTLVNLGVHNPQVTTTGPASINPDTGKPYGLTFPVVTIEDFVHVQKALLDSLGIKKLHGVAGASMGSLQTLVWAAKYPEMVPRAMPVISPGASGTPYLIGMLKTWADPIKLDANWNGGDYYGKDLPKAGLGVALQSVTMDAFQAGWVAKHDNQWADQTQDPALNLKALYSVEKMLNERGQSRAAIADANHFLYLVRACQTYDIRADLDKIKAKFLFLPAEGDLIFPPEESMKLAETLKNQGNEVDLQVITGPLGHINGVVFLPQAEEKIRAWLE
ncbi:E22 family MetX-like putative esterase [Aestuariispira insulae]|uniref:Probable acyltransferase n=1 Tax=Aestuariispira insulae TaxID=1461337 RepID=A0A3D9HDY2_9PROT|nr:homoserine O-acetyltransferase [Aestuariispira insulae]RED47683.1 homoserine O-acetyltransferase [Aestuariispira insulae]